MPDPNPTASRHPFVERPHRTFVALSIPVLASLVIEPLTGLVDAAFVARLGPEPLAGLGAGTQVLSSLFWIFNFLAIGTQTEVAAALGSDDARGRDAASLALAVAFGLGIAVSVIAWLATPAAIAFMSDEAGVQHEMRRYVAVRLLGAPALLITFAGFGALRGLHRMRVPLAIAAGTNAINLALDPLLIFGAGPVPAFGVAGAAAASVVAQWFGAVWVLSAVRRRLGISRRIPWAQAPALFVVGRDLFLRTGLLTLFLLLTTRAATHIGADAGAAHTVVRQVWFFAAFLLDAYATAAQSLVATFLGDGRRAQARRVATIAVQWSLATGVVLGIVMLISESWVAAAFVPASALPYFSGAWWMLALAQPINALSFATDGIHWGTGDYAYLRNAMVVASGAGIAGLTWVSTPDGTLTALWAITAVWIGLRAIFGALRIWPGIGAAPLRREPRL